VCSTLSNEQNKYTSAHYLEPVLAEISVVNGYVGSSSDQFHGHFFTPNGLTGAVYRRHLVTELPAILDMCPFINDNTCGSCVDI
jgi:hypothetical protein